MDISIRRDFDCVDWKAICRILSKAGLGEREPEKLQRAFGRSAAKASAFDGDRIVGVGRVLSDGEYQAAIYDMAVLPEYQGKGIGMRIVLDLLEQVGVDNVILYAVPGVEPFYRKAGFKPMKTAMAKLHQAMANPEAGYLLPDWGENAGERRPMDQLP